MNVLWLQSGGCGGCSMSLLCADTPDFPAMLKAGGTQHHSELLKPFGLDATDPEFWQKGLSVISRLIDELETKENA